MPPLKTWVTGGFRHGEVIDPHFHFFDLRDCSTSGQDPKVLSDFQVQKGKFGKVGRAGKDYGKLGDVWFSGGKFIYVIEEDARV